MQDRGFGSGVSMVVSTASDIPGLSANAVDSFDIDHGIIVLRGFEAGPGIVLDIVNYDDNVYDTTQNRLRITSTASVNGGYSIGQNISNSGYPVFAQTVGSTLEFNSLAAGNNITMSSVNGLITINSTGLTGAANVGTGLGVYSQTNGTTLQFRNILAGPSGNLTTTIVGGDIVIDTITKTSLITDTTPTLGANLNVNGKAIVSSSNGNIILAPNGTGSVVLGAVTFPNNTGSAGQVLTSNGNGTLSWDTVNLASYQGTSLGTGTPVYQGMSGNTLEFASLASGSGKVAISISSGTIDIDVVPSSISINTLGGGPLSILNGGTGATTVSGALTNLGLGTMATQNSNSVTITGGAITGTTISGSTGSFVGLTSTGPVVLDGNTFPTNTGTAGQFLSTDGAGNLSWATPSGSGSGTGLSNGANLGSGVGIYAGVNGSTIDFLSLVAGTNISLTQSANSITISTTAAAGATTFTALTDAPSTYANSANKAVVVNPSATGLAFTTLAAVATTGSYTSLTGTPVLAASATTDTTNASNITSGTLNVSRLPTVGVAGTYGSATQYPVVTTDAYGRVTAVSLQTVSSGGLSSLSLTGDASGTNSGTNLAVTLATVNNNVGTFGSGTVIPVVTVNAKGLVTSVTTSPVTLPNVGTAGTYGSATQYPVITTDANGRVTAVTLQTAPGAGGGLSSVTVSGDATGSTSTGPLTLTLNNVNASAGTYGSGSLIPVVTVNAKGLVTGITSTALTLPAVGTAGTYGSATQVPVITTDANGRVTAVSLQTITGGSGGLSSLTLTGDATGTNSGTNLAVTLASVGTAGTYGSATQVPVFVTDAKGRVTSVTNTAISSMVTVTDGTNTVNNATNITFNGATVAVNGSTATVTVSGSAAAFTKYVVSWVWNSSGVPTNITVPSGWASAYANGTITITTSNLGSLSLINGAFWGAQAGSTTYSAKYPTGSQLTQQVTSGVFTINLGGGTINSPTGFGSNNGGSGYIDLIFG